MRPFSAYIHILFFRRSADLPAWARPAALTAVANALMALPAHAEAGKIFDFNLTLPLMAGQFLLLMVFLDKTWFGPVGRLLEERDAELRSKLGAFRDNRCAS
jgi:F-type H+-transporting ATPase subunit b